MESSSSTRITRKRRNVGSFSRCRLRPVCWSRSSPSAANAFESSRVGGQLVGRPSGMKKSYDFSKGRRAKKRDLPPAEELDRHTKIRITILLDADVLDYFKRA